MDTPAEIAAALRPVRMPPATGAEAFADALLAFSLGLVAALVLLALLRFVVARRRSPGRVAAAELAAARDLPAPARIFAQARLLDRLAARRRLPQAGAEALARRLRPALYRPDPAVDLDAVDTGIVALASQRRKA